MALVAVREGCGGQGRHHQVGCASAWSLNSNSAPLGAVGTHSCPVSGHRSVHMKNDSFSGSDLLEVLWSAVPEVHEVVRDTAT